MPRKFVIGDIRGDLYLLEKLMDKIAPGEHDVLIFLGSYLGPGGDSKGVLDYLLELRKQPGTYIFLKGCYEYMFLQCIQEKPSIGKATLWSKMGGNQVFESYSAKKKLVVMSPANGHPSEPTAVEIPLHIPEPHIRFMEHNLHGIFTDDVLPFVACHNGFYAGAAGSDIPEEFSVFTPRGWLEDSTLRLPGKEIVFSHIPRSEVYMKSGKIDLDLGAGLGGKLCAMEMYNRKFTYSKR